MSIEHKITVPGRFPGMNQFIAALNTNRIVGNKMKQADQEAICLLIKSQMRGIHINRPVTLHYHYYEPNQKRDLDNISGFFHKIFQDALVASGVLDNDGWKNIYSFSDRFSVDSKNPRVEVIIIEQEE